MLLCGWGLAAAQVQVQVLDEGGASLVRARVERDGAFGPWRVLDHFPGRAEPGPSGADPEGRALFATWTRADGRRYDSFTRDGGETWAAARLRRGGVRLRAGALVVDQPPPFAPADWRQPSAGRLFVVALATRSLPEFRRALTEAGAEILASIPRDGHLIRCAPDRIHQITALDFVERVVPFHPWYRLSPEVQRWVRRAPPDDRQPLRLTVAGWGLEAKTLLAERARALGAQILALPDSGRVLEILADRAQLEVLARSDRLLWVDPWTPSETDMDLVREDSGRVWVENDAGTCGQGVRGEVLDSGFEETHQDFDGVMLHGPHDLMNHGSSTYGIVFGNGRRDGDGDARAEGLLSCAEQGIFADKDELTDRFAHTQELLDYPYYASFQTNSWGHTRTTAYTSYSQEMDDIVWRLDLAITQSQSNSGTQSSRPEAWAKNVISVGAIKHGNSLDPADDFWGGSASIGPAEDGRIKPDVCYWGDHIYTTVTGGYRPDFNGTSAATPEVAGILGLQIQMWSENVWNTNPIGENVFQRRPHAATSKALLINSARQYPFSGTDHDLTRTHQGWGRPGVRSAKESAARSLVIDETTALQVGQSAFYDVEVIAGESELKITLVYTDPPGTLSAAMHRINDLDLLVTAPTGEIFYGNQGLDVGTASVAGGAPDDINTVENVFIPFPEAGLWQIEVRAVEINQDAHTATAEDDAVFALVVSGATGSSACAAGSTPANLIATPAADNQVQLQWDPTADGVEYLIYRSRESCAAGFEQIAVAGTTNFLDEPVSGAVTYHYQVRAKNDCGGVSDASNCADATPTGACVDPPAFDGLTEARDLGQQTCTVELRWNAAAPRCGARVQYNIYRSTDPAFVPDPGNRVATCIDATTWSDTGIDDGMQLYWVVRAEDTGAVGSGPCGGVEDDNRVRRTASASGPDLILFSDDFETVQPWTLEGEWEIGPPLGLGGSLLGGPDPEVAWEGSQVLGLDLSGQGKYAGNYEAEISEWATSPTFDASAQSVVELRFWRWLGVEENSSDLALLEAWDGAAWNEIWRNPHLTLSDKNWALEVFDLSSALAGVADARLRFGVISSFNRSFCGWNVDKLEVYSPTTCQAGRSSPAPVPDGRFVSGTPMLASRAATAEFVDLQWDVSSCAGSRFNLFYGSSDELASYTYSGSSCDLDPAGSDSRALPDPVPGKFTWWLIAGAEGSVDGAHGYRSDGTLRPANGIGMCALDNQDTTATCQAGP
ncbi:MAG TPA: hypothetical protein ENK10_00035 [Acidobacteria bacterium]|nr:hypothetical protein [Acidobacteriota bacterium]